MMQVEDENEDNALQFLRKAYLRRFPINNANEILSNYRSIIINKDLIHGQKPNSQTLNRLLDVTIDLINSSKRFQKLTMAKLIRWHAQPVILNSKLKDKLFRVFQSLIITAKEEVAWKLSVSLKDISLKPEHINWLIENHTKSLHIQNRLLRYPKKNVHISKWGLDCLQNEILLDRESELIGLVLNSNSRFFYKDSTSFLWGIYYSKLTQRQKKALLLTNLSIDNLTDYIKICEKNDYEDLIEKAFHIYFGMPKTNNVKF